MEEGRRGDRDRLQLQVCIRPLFTNNIMSIISQLHEETMCSTRKKGQMFVVLHVIVTPV